jgi:predicted dehydrogenase
LITIGLIELSNEKLGPIPATADGFRIVPLTSRRRELERSLSDPRLDAVAILGLDPRRDLFAEKALLKGKHVLIDFPVADTFQRATRIHRIATETKKRVYSANLLRTEPGLQELKKKAANSSGKLLSLTVTCGVNTEGRLSEFAMKTAQVLDAMEWLGDSALVDLATERTAAGSTRALVTLASFDNGLKTMLNMYSTPAGSDDSRLWVDAVFEDSVIHVNPREQSISVASFRNHSVHKLNWATPSLIGAIENFLSCMKTEMQPMDLGNLQRLLKLANSAVRG